MEAFFSLIQNLNIIFLLWQQKHLKFDLVLLSGCKFRIVKIFISQQPWPIEGIEKHK